MSRVLVISDTHYPVARDGHLDFLLETYEAWDCDRVCHIGDLVDHCALSFHIKAPSLKNPIDEYEKAMRDIEELVKYFPEVDLMVGNHDALPWRWAKEVGIPAEYLRSPADMWNLPDTWTVHPRYGQLVIDNVLFQHGDKGRASAVLNAKDEFMSCVQGHHHSKFGVEFFANAHTRIFGLQVGCLVDHTTLAMEYGQKFSRKPLLGCGVVLDGITPIAEPWNL